jgi:hypothetical protein
LKCSQESSRLKNRDGPKAATPAGASEGCTCSCNVILNLVKPMDFFRAPANCHTALGHYPIKLYHLRYGCGDF